MATTPRLSRTVQRAQLAAVFKDPQTLKAAENLFLDVAENIPQSLDDNTEATESAQATANQADAKAETAQQTATETKGQPFLVATTTAALPNSRVLAVNPGLALTNSGGNVTLSPGNTLKSLQDLTTLGFVARTAANTVFTRELKAGSAKVTVTNGKGTAGDPVIDVQESELSLSNIGGTLGVSQGGTGATTATAARTALGINGLVSATGDYKQRAAASFPAGWVRANTGTIGSAASGATRANADTQALFTLWWTDFTDAQVPVLTSGGAATNRGATAAADFAADKRMTVPVEADSGFLIGAYKL